MEPNTRQEVAEAIRERTGEDVSTLLHDDCLARYEVLNLEERRLLIEYASERVFASLELASLLEETRNEARKTLETIWKLLFDPRFLVDESSEEASGG
jgi:hypothetical protein